MEPAVFLRVEGEETTKQSTEVNIPVRIKSEETIGAISLVISYPEKIFRIAAINTPYCNDNITYYAANGELRIAWYADQPILFQADDVVFTISGEWTKTEQPIALEAIAGSELTDYNATPISRVSLSYPKITTTAFGSNLSVNTPSPNPFDANTSISYTLHENSNLRIEILDILGKEITQLAQGIQQAGNHQLLIDGTMLAPGMYYCRFTSPGTNQQTIRLIKLR
jgi:hypothetical protein